MTTQRIAYLGNFQPDHSTENDVLATLRRLGHEVVPLQENVPSSWQRITVEYLLVHAVDVVLWTRTGWNPPVPHDRQLEMLEACRNACVPTVGFHLDRWWGLAREGQVHEEPFFRCDLVATADGGHDDDWAAAGVHHVWSPPAIAEFSIGWGRMDTRLATDVAFVGSWQSYHPEWAWRRDLIAAMRGHFGRRFRCWPEPGQHAVRGDRLRDLYASATVVVGDSCLVGAPSRYWSDRVPETLGRAGLLVHPDVDGLREAYPSGTLELVEPESVTAMVTAVEYLLGMPVAEQMERRRAALVHTQQHHTYRHRLEPLLAMAAEMRTEMVS